MALLTIELDTETSAFSAAVDGTSVDNIYSVSIYRYDDGVHFEVSTYERVGDVVKNTRLIASQLTPAQAAIASLLGGDVR